MSPGMALSLSSQPWAIGARPFTFQPGADRRQVAAGCASLISSWPCAAVRPCAFPCSPAWQYSAGRQRSRALRSTPSAPRIYPSWMKSGLMSGAKPHVRNFRSFSSFGPPTRSLINPCFWSRCAIARPRPRRQRVAPKGGRPSPSLEANSKPSEHQRQVRLPLAIVVSPLGTACRSRPLAACCERLALDGSGSKLGHDGRFPCPACDRLAAGDSKHLCRRLHRKASFDGNGRSRRFRF